MRKGWILVGLLLAPLMGYAAPIDELPPEVLKLQLDGDASQPTVISTSYGGFLVDFIVTPTPSSAGQGVLEAQLVLSGVGAVVIPVPQPAAGALLGVGLMGLGLLGRRRGD